VTLFVGMSGWAYPEWRGAFYPAGLASVEMLPAYAAVFGTVEINNTYYRMPAAATLAGWANRVPSEFRFSFKANQGITRSKEFANRGDRLNWFCHQIEATGEHLGPVLFQFESRADLPQLATFLELARPLVQRIVVEFRHKSWFTDGTYELLRAQGVALCQTETDAGCDPLVSAPDFSYVRLRKSAYTSDEVRERLNGLRETAVAGRDVFCYLKHDVENAVLLRDLRAELPES
jgi:uncharacterized protein YecE (DUF72 family)